MVGGLNFIWPQGRNVTGYQFTDDVNWNHGNHNIQFGWTMRRNDVTDYSPSVTTTPEAVPSILTGINTSFQNGQVDEYVQQFPQRLTQPVALYAMGWYIQDQWKVQPNLTVTYGMRFEHNSNPVCHTNCFARLPGDFSDASTSPDTPYQNIIQYGQHRAFNSLQAHRLGAACWLCLLCLTRRPRFAAASECLPMLSPARLPARS